MTGNNAFLGEVSHQNYQPMLLTGALLVFTTTPYFLKNRIYFHI